MSDKTTLSPEQRRLLLVTPAGWLACGLGSGLAPAAQGTFGSLAAVLPYDAVISPGVLVRWLRRCGTVVLLTAVVAMFTLLLPRYLPAARYLAASLVGLGLMLALAAYLATLVRRR